MHPKQRMMDQKAEMEVRLRDLKLYCESDYFKNDIPEEQERLKKEVAYLESYIQKLDEQIAA